MTNEPDYIIVRDMLTLRALVASGEALLVATPDMTWCWHAQCAVASAVVTTDVHDRLEVRAYRRGSGWHQLVGRRCDRCGSSMLLSPLAYKP